ncbi:MAG: SCP2 sterol-binding domain-containing protein [bacterium]
MPQPGNIFVQQMLSLLSEVSHQISASALATDPVTAGRFAKFAGRCIELQSHSPRFTAHLVLQADGIQTFPGPAETPHVIISGSGRDLLQALLPGGNPAGLKIEGDTALVFNLSALLNRFSPDLTTPLSRFIGAANAANLMGSAELGLAGLKTAFTGLARTVQQQATGQYVKTSELDELLHGIDRLRLRVDRLAANLSRVEQVRRQADPR